jgi:hypothetical protein
MEAVSIDKVVLLDYMTSKEALEEPKIGRTDPSMPIDHNCMDEKLYFGLPGGSGDYQDESDKSDERNTIPTASRRWRPATELERFDQGTSDVDGCEGEDGDDADADADEEEEALQGDYGSMQNVEDWGHSTRQCEDWTVYFRHVKYVNGDANATASDVSEVKTIAISYKISMLNINESAAYSYQPKKGIIISRHCVNGYSITAAPEKSVPHVSFWWCAYQVHSNGGKYATWRETCNSRSEATRFHQSHLTRPEHPVVSDGNKSCCWCVVECSTLHWPLVEEYSGLHQCWNAGAPGWV